MIPMRIGFMALGMIIGITFSLPAFAASGDTMTGSTLTDRLDTLLIALGPTHPDRKTLRDATDAEEETAKARGFYRARRATFMTDCRRDIRSANRDTKFPTTLRCFRGLLMQRLGYLRDERRNRPLGFGPAHDLLLSRTDALTDAMTTIVDAIDSDVYDDDASLKDAKARLYAQYEEPYAAAILAAQAERLEHWLFVLVNDLDRIAAADLHREHVDVLLPVADCLEQTSWQLTDAKQATTIATGRTLLEAADATLADCADFFVETETALRAGSGSTLPTE